ncbi:hypothetical protein FSOLCH5_15463 [Fusarium solani]
MSAIHGHVGPVIREGHAHDSSPVSSVSLTTVDNNGDNTLLVHGWIPGELPCGKHRRRMQPHGPEPKRAWRLVIWERINKSTTQLETSGREAHLNWMVCNYSQPKTVRPRVLSHCGEP